MRSLRILTCSLLFVGGCLLAGCNQDKLFDEQEPRSQFDRYALLRGRFRPQKKETGLGVDEPALRARLAPLEQAE